MKFNGWHRLWLLLSIIYFVLVISFVIVNFPTAEKIPHASEFYKKLSKRSAEMIIPTNHADAVILGDESVVPLDDLPQRLIWELKMKKLEMPNGHTIAFSAKSSKEDMRIASQEYWKAVEQKASEKRRHILLYAFLFWLVPCMGLYALGWGINWVHKGFKQKKTAQPGAQADPE